MKSAYKVFLAGLCSLFLVACGGGGSISDDGTGTTPSDKYVIKLGLTNSSGQSITEVSNAAPGKLTAELTKNGSPYVGRIIFSLEGDGVLTPESGVTNTDGKVSIDVLPGNKPGSGRITATYTPTSGVAVTSSPVDFGTKGDGGAANGSAQVSLMLTDSSGTAVQSITSTTPGVLTATVTGLSKAAIVTFESTVGDLPVKTAITDPNGKASVTLYAGSSINAGTATASLSSGESDSIAFSIGATNVVMGSGSPFVSGKADVSAATLSAGGTATVSVLLRDSDGNPFTEPVDVKFASTCANKATPEAVLSTPVTAVGGQATSTYLAKGCFGDDPITVTADVGGKTLSATGTINVLSASVGSIVFLDATPKNIGIKGTGGVESSILRFKVLDTNNNPVANKTVNFTLNNPSSAGAKINPVSATSNSEGIVQTVVNSGTIAETVRVTATISGTSISSQSNLLVVSTGKPDQDSFSLSATALNVEGWNYDGATVTITARLADAFNNPVPDGTAVYFTAEGGAIESSCTTNKGVCSVVWTSQLPRPIGSNIGFFDLNGIQQKDPSAMLQQETNLVGGKYYGNKFGQPYGGRVTILATAIGEESFPDLNSNNILDLKAEFDLFKSITDTDGKITGCGRDNSGDCYDLSEAFVDHNEDGIYTPKYIDKTSDPQKLEPSGERETYVDFIDPSFPSGEGKFDVADIAYNGVLCDSSASGVKCSDQKSISVRRSLVLVMSGSDAVATRPTNVAINDVTGKSQIDLATKGTAKVTFTIADLNNQQMPAGTVVNFKATGASVTSSTSYTWPSTNYNGGRQFTVSLKGSDQADTGNFIVTVTTLGISGAGIEGTTTEVLNMPIVVTAPVTP
ncbi:Ig-like domain-containing protein [Shewanella mangrovisoli]|uniref:Ig-like domain-containing protein n=1 Tax=Shewanella mangrovisoli TaxID=2864211 RepID=A0ABV4VKY8_9GAMM